MDLHLPHAIVDDRGYFLQREILGKLRTGDIVRVSFTMHIAYDDIYQSDSPYVKILEKTGSIIVGEILDLNRQEDDVLYPLRTGEKIWFFETHVFEIPLFEHASKARKKELSKYRANTHMPFTGTRGGLFEETYTLSALACSRPSSN